MIYKELVEHFRTLASDLEKLVKESQVVTLEDMLDGAGDTAFQFADGFIVNVRRLAEIDKEASRLRYKLDNYTDAENLG